VTHLGTRRPWVRSSERWKRSRLYEWLGLKGYVAFNLPRTVTTLGAALLTGIVAAHVYVLTSRPSLPMYFVVYTAILGACCLFTAAFLWRGRNPLVPQRGWFIGDRAEASGALVAVPRIS